MRPPAPRRAFAGHLAEGTGLVLADGSPPMPPDVQGFGRSLLHAAQAMLVSGFGAACLLNSDSPTLPTALLIRAARVLLAPGERIVLGPADDGGYYLIGMKRPHAHLFADIAWSTGEVAAMTRARAAALGIELVALPTWYDVDDAATLARLVAEASGAASCTDLRPYAAPATRECIKRIGLTGHLSIAAQWPHACRMMTTPMRRMAMLAAIGATLVALVVAGLAVLDWNTASLEDSTPRVAAFVASICLAGLLWLLAAAPLVRAPRGSRLRSAVPPRSSRCSMSPVNNPTLADATPGRTERLMTVTAIKDPRRYFEAVDSAEAAGNRAAGVSLS